MGAELPAIEEAIAALEARIEQADAEGSPLLAASAGVLLGALLVKAQHPAAGERCRAAGAVLERAADLERPLRLARAFALRE